LPLVTLHRGLSVARSAVNGSITAAEGDYEALSDGGEDAEGEPIVQYFEHPRSLTDRALEVTPEQLGKSNYEQQAVGIF
jgi:hypothetical protein